MNMKKYAITALLFFLPSVSFAFGISPTIYYLGEDPNPDILITDPGVNPYVIFDTVSGGYLSGVGSYSEGENINGSGVFDAQGSYAVVEVSDSNPPCSSGDIYSDCITGPSFVSQILIDIFSGNPPLGPLVPVGGMISLAVTSTGQAIEHPVEIILGFSALLVALTCGVLWIYSWIGTKGYSNSIMATSDLDSKNRLFEAQMHNSDLLARGDKVQTIATLGETEFYGSHDTDPQDMDDDPNLFV